MKALASLITLWRTRAGVMLSGLLVLDALIFGYAKTAGAHTRIAGIVWSATTSGTGFLLVLCTLEAFLGWRVWRGGSVAWCLLLVLIGISAVKALEAVVSLPGTYQLGLLVLLMVQLTLLLSPAVRGHRPGIPVAPSR